MEKDEEKTVKLENDQEKNIGEIKEETQEEVRQTRKSRREKSKEDKRKITIHVYSQIEDVINTLFKNNASLLSLNDLFLPDYKVDENNFIIFDDPYLKRTKIHKTKDSILDFIETTVVNSTRDIVKGKKNDNR